MRFSILLAIIPLAAAAVVERGNTGSWEEALNECTAKRAHCINDGNSVVDCLREYGSCLVKQG
ncbi:uncharacterized protein TrAFT101_000724 [Trichoderma asperellum]|uniref:uncharacterized protein n=1 Tax=Trichoderma asperellum TaxID=101201 RepID=UPI00332FA687|nr:hypothetical protein TrAFT101_000724 [Trichoderma asperellum]